jgi:hypothetical protein
MTPAGFVGEEKKMRVAVRHTNSPPAVQPPKSASITDNTARIRLVVTASMIGTIIERYDFFIYGTAAALVFAPLFFSNAGPVVGTLAAFATYAFGFAVRPIGGAVLGHSETSWAARPSSSPR